MEVMKRTQELWDDLVRRNSPRKRGSTFGVLHREGEAKRTFSEVERERYSKENYLHLGMEQTEYPSALDVAGTIEMLDIFRSGEYMDGLHDIDVDPILMPPPIARGQHVCDFCGYVGSESEFIILGDGRERCEICSKTVIHSARKVREIFRETKRGMEKYFGIAFENSIEVKVVSARRLHLLSNKEFVPTSGFDTRAIGFALAKQGKQTVVLENGSPKNSFIGTIAHELTHCWQNQIPFYSNLSQLTSEGKIDEETRSILLEGQATWAEVQYLYLIGELQAAENERDSYLRRDDEYGKGFRLFLSHYPFATSEMRLRETPFDHPVQPIK